MRKYYTVFDKENNRIGFALSKNKNTIAKQDFKNTNKQLFGDLFQNFELDTSNRQFFSTPNTRITNDQGAYAEYLYGNMPSGKSSGPDGAFARVQDNYRYILI